MAAAPEGTLGAACCDDPSHDHSDMKRAVCREARRQQLVGCGRLACKSESGFPVMPARVEDFEHLYRGGDVREAWWIGRRCHALQSVDIRSAAASNSGR